MTKRDLPSIGLVFCTYDTAYFHNGRHIKYMSFRQGRHLTNLILLGNDLGCPITIFETNYPEYESEVTLVLLLCFFFLIAEES